MDLVATTLFGKARRVVLGQLFLDPQRDFRLRELARLGQSSPGALQHEIKQLVAADLVTRTEKNGLVTYRANARSPIHAELRAIIEKTSGIEGLLRQALLPFTREIRLAMIYGSIAKGVNTSASDLDLLVVGAIPFAALMKLVAPVEERIAREISPRVFSVEEFEARLGRKDRFLTAVMRGPKVVLIGSVDDA